MAWKKTNDIHYQNIADSIRYAKDGTEYTTTLERARAEIERYTPLQMEEEIQDLAEKYVSAVGELGEDTAIFNDISTAIQSKTGQVESYEKDEMAEAINDIAYPPILESKVITPKLEKKTYIPTAPSVGFSSVTVEAGYPAPSGTINISQNGTVSVSGYANANVGVYEVESYLANTLTSVTLPTLTSIPNNAFKSKSALVSVSAPNATSLGNYAFLGCSNLETISFSNQMTSIGEECFYNCQKLLLSELPDTITTIRARAFQSCEKIDITKLPSSITSIGSYAFYDCRAIPFLDMTDMPMVPPTLGSNVFETRRKLIFYFDTQAKLDAYSVATNWSTYASSFQIKGATP